MPESLLSCKLIDKETPTQVFSCEFYKIFKSNFFKEYLRTTASGYYVFFKQLLQAFRKYLEHFEKGLFLK